mmetsp:Transcript_70958/g.205696  ORF Transcript_70958/g.205696 Transcript_70958/m.205696 type:complete len:190 (-) Transcript_70958:1315-1884(-)
MNTIWSKLGRSCSWFKTTMAPTGEARSELQSSCAPSQRLRSALSNARPVFASTAASGSSNSNNDGLPYKARARPKRVCCPPESVVPRSPTSSSSPPSSCSRSWARHASAKQRPSLYSSTARPSKMFSSNVPEMTNGFCGAQPTSAMVRAWPRTEASPANSPTRADKKVLLPEPTAPQTAVNVPRRPSST